MNEPWVLFLMIAGIINTVLLVRLGWQRPWWLAVIAAGIGFAPMILNITADLVGARLGCFVHGPISPCMVKSVDVGTVLNLMVLAGLLFSLTWSFAAASLVLFAAKAVRWARRRLA